MAIGKSRRDLRREQDRRHVQGRGGVEEAKAELQEVVEFLKDPKRYGRLGARVRRACCWSARRAPARRCSRARSPARPACRSSPSRARSSSRCSSASGAARVRDLFEQARQKAPAIIFIDELDALGRARGAGGIGGHDEREQTLNQLLVELDGFDPSTGLVLLAATNRPEILDPALLRAGRFDRVVLVDRPDKTGRLQILQVHARKVKLAADVDLDKIAASTPGFSGADLANLVNEAALLATRRGAEAVTRPTSPRRSSA
jgi:cell division protease FtsH